MNKSKVKDFYEDKEDFEKLLEEAEEKASKHNEVIFVDQLVKNYSDWGMDLFLSDAQHEWLRSIARR